MKVRKRVFEERDAIRINSGSQQGCQNKLYKFSKV